MNKSILSQDEWALKFKEHAVGFFRNSFEILDLRSVIFHNPVNHDSMRLSKKGYSFLKVHLKIVEYPITVAPLMPQDLLLLERHLRCPYYILYINKLAIFDEITASMLYLHQGNLRQYLDNLNTHS